MLRSREAAGLAEVSSDAYNSPGGEEQSGAPTAAPLFLTAAGLAELSNDAYNSQREKSSPGRDSRTCAARFYAMYRACDWQAPVGWVVLLFLLICIRLMLVFLRSV